MQLLTPRTTRATVWAALALCTMSCGGGSSPAGPSPQPTSPPAAAAPTVTAVSPSRGATAGGVPITITGTGFASGASVSIGGAAATGVAFQSATSITATTPAHAAGAADVVVTNPDGQSGRMSGGFTFDVPVAAPPAMTSIGPTSGPVAGGTNVTITGSGFTAGATVSFGAAQATNVSVASPTTITAVAPSANAGSVDVAVVNPDGQSAKLTGAYTYVGSAPPPPPPPAPVAPTVTGVSPSTGSTAGGTVVTITGTGFAAGASVSFDGTAATNVAVTSATSITATTPARAAGAAAVTVTNSNGQSGQLNAAFTFTAPAPPPPPPTTVVVVTITLNGVSPSDVTISPGQRIRFVNNDVLAHNMTSDPHPDHTQCPPLNAVGLLLPGQSRDSDPLTTIRSCGYHDHNDADNPRWIGTVQIK